MSSKLVYAYLAGCYGRDGMVCPSVARIALEAGIGERQVGRCLEELRRKNLIESERTGRANVYRFTPLDDDGARSARPCLSPVSDRTSTSDQDRTSMSDQQQSHLIKQKKREKTTTPAVVVSFDPGELNQAIDSIREDVPRTKSLRRTIREGIAEHGLEHVLHSIAYCNEKSRTSYGAYLSRAIADSWGEGWNPKPKAPPEPNPSKKAAEEAQEAASFAREQVELIKARQEASRKFRELPPGAQEAARQRFLDGTTPFTRRRCEKLDIPNLAESVSFLVWFADIS